MNAHVSTRGLAAEAAVFLLDARDIGVEHDALTPGERHEALAAGPADEGEAGLARQIDAPGGEARARGEDGDAHDHALDDHFRRQPAGGVEDLVVGRDAVEEHPAGDLVDRIVPPDVLDIGQHAVLLAPARSRGWRRP
jgi:hypothetical protein